MDKFGVYKQEVETKLNINPELLYGRKETKIRTQTEQHSCWNCKNSTSTSDAGLCWDGTGVWKGRRGEGQRYHELVVRSGEGSRGGIGGGGGRLGEQRSVAVGCGEIGAGWLLRGTGNMLYYWC